LAESGWLFFPRRKEFFLSVGGKMVQKQAGLTPRPDTSLTASVQNILKKMKKRLVRPFKPR
jgi:uncharacterized protein YjdB